MKTLDRSVETFEGNFKFLQPEKHQTMSDCYQMEENINLKLLKCNKVLRITLRVVKYNKDGWVSCVVDN